MERAGLIERLISRLEQAGLSLTYEDLADALWLAQQIDAPPLPSPTAKPSNNIGSRHANEPKATLTARDDQRPYSLPLVAADTVVASQMTSDLDTQAGLPLSVPAAAALPNAIKLSRALKIISRRVDSQTQVELDEEATVEQVASQRIFSPVVRFEQERWLDLELVIEESSMSFVWRKTVEEFRRKVLERLGAFRNMRTWRLQADDNHELQLWPYVSGQKKSGASRFTATRPRSPKALIHPGGRKLVLLVSDCRSPLWQARPQQPQIAAQKQSSQSTIYDWLQQWSQRGPTAVVQLLPERLWAQTELGYGDAVQLSALTPGCINSNLKVEGAVGWHTEENYRPNSLSLPVVTLESEPMRQWAKVLRGQGNERSPGFWFDVNLLHQFPSETVRSVAHISSEAKVNRFFASAASPIAKKLMRLMAAAPVSLSVVHLIQEKMLKEATPVHIAEVYMSGLLHDTLQKNSDGEPIYDFESTVRDRIVQVSDPDLTIQVFNNLTEKIAEDIDEPLESFDALLSPDPAWMSASGLVAPFAAVAMQVLKSMGGAYAALAATVEQTQAIQRVRGPERTSVFFPPLQVLYFQVGALVDSELDEAVVLPQPPKTASSQVATVGVPPRPLDKIEFTVAKISRVRSGAFRRQQWVVNRHCAQADAFVELLADEVTLEMIAIPKGRFRMGSLENEAARLPNEGPQHEVKVPQFFMGRYPITQGQWRFVASLPRQKQALSLNPSAPKSDAFPVEQVSWYEAIEFCDRLSAHTKRQYRLPTEAEWEYACRANTTTPFHFGDMILTEVANYDGNYAYADGPKGEYRMDMTPVNAFGHANAFGLCDMHGNVWEWCQDHWRSDYRGAPADGSAWLTDQAGSKRVRRGGSWFYYPENCRSAFRSSLSPENRAKSVSFRVCFSGLI